MATTDKETKLLKGWRYILSRNYFWYQYVFLCSATCENSFLNSELCKDDLRNISFRFDFCLNQDNELVSRRGLTYYLLGKQAIVGQYAHVFRGKNWFKNLQTWWSCVRLESNVW